MIPRFLAYRETATLVYRDDRGVADATPENGNDALMAKLRLLARSEPGLQFRVGAGREVVGTARY
jgi:hypothetical protein